LRKLLQITEKAKKQAGDRAGAPGINRKWLQLAAVHLQALDMKGSSIDE